MNNSKRLARVNMAGSQPNEEIEFLAVNHEAAEGLFLRKKSKNT